MNTRLIPYGAFLWCLLYAALSLHWSLGGDHFPFGRHWDAGGQAVSVLDYFGQAALAPWMTAVALAGAVLALALARNTTAPSRVVTGLGWTMAVGLAVVIPDYRPLLHIARAPLLLMHKVFGWFPGAAEFPWLEWPVLNQYLLILGGGLFAWSALTHGRGTAAPRPWTTPASAARWGAWATYIAIVVPLAYAMTRWAWYLGIPLGITREALREAAQESPGIWLAGAGLASLGIGGAILTLGLVRRWGEVYPRWIPYLRGRRVHPRTAIIPASVVSVVVTSAGLMIDRKYLLGEIPHEGLGWASIPMMLFPVWGVALGAATLAYHLRRRPAPAAVPSGARR
ncbi:hypothetical protein [Streptosporangium sp. NPDC048865]|uniref:hypothetical protein n=1 Tax=Streptosporangium sp. NPDC048865 TaxID=3155766 RepID=UPI003419EE32